MSDDADADLDGRFVSAAKKMQKRDLIQPTANFTNWSPGTWIMRCSLGSTETVRVDLHRAMQNSGDIPSKATAMPACQ
jgi:hypothetical protein